MENFDWQDTIFKVRKEFQNPALTGAYPELLTMSVYRDVVTLTASIHRHRSTLKKATVEPNHVPTVSFLAE